MPTETQIVQEEPTYLVDTEGELVLNAAGIDALARYRKAQKDYLALDASWAGAVLARLFLQHAWLNAVRLSFSVTAEYDDNGRFYRSVSCQAVSPRAVPQQALPEALFPEGKFNSDVAASVVGEELLDYEFDLYVGLAADPDGYDDLSVSLERDAIAPLLQQSPLDGRLACMVWGLTRSG